MTKQRKKAAVKAEKKPQRKSVRMTEMQARGLLAKQVALHEAKRNMLTYIQAMLDAEQIDGDWELVSVENRSLILEKTDD